MANLIKSSWLKGPTFQWEREIVADERSPDLLVGDPEVKVLRTETCVRGSFLERLSKFFDCNTALNSIARIKRHIYIYKSVFISTEEREKAALVLIKAAQREAFEEELKWLSQTQLSYQKVTGYTNLILSYNIQVRVGGRLRKSEAAINWKHPIILPKEGVVIQLILDHCHKKTQHQGRG